MCASPLQALDILILEGDGIGPEVTSQALAVLKETAAHHSLDLRIESTLFGGASVDDSGKLITDETLALACDAHAVLVGAVGGPKWDWLKAEERPESGLLALRKELGVYANLRPALTFPGLEDLSVLRPGLAKDLDLLFVRELTGGIYYGIPRDIYREAPDPYALNTMAYTESEVRRVGEVAFQLARKRKGRLARVDKANVLEVQMLWRAAIGRLHEDHADVELSHIYVDNCAMQLVLNPKQFDVLVTSNLFGDILSDEGAALARSIGMLSSALLGDGTAIYEPVHGSAPDIAVGGIANPLAAILSVSMLLEHTAGQPGSARHIEKAVEQALHQGLRTSDLFPHGTAQGTRLAGTTEMGSAVMEELRTVVEKE